jgi:hypothetical protein
MDRKGYTGFWSSPMKWPVALGFTLLVVCGACERQVKPANGRTPTPPNPPTAPTATTKSQDQTPDLEQHPLALYEGGRRSATTDLKNVPIELDGTVKKYFQSTPAAAKQPPDGFAATVNHFCPVSPKHALGEFTAIEHTVQFEGQTVGFCCDDCPEAWKEMTDVEKRTALKAALEKKADK